MSSPFPDPLSPDRLVAGADDGGVRLEDFLAQRWPDADRKFWRRACREQAITVNMLPAHPQQRLAVGDVIDLELDPQAAPSRRDEGGGSSSEEEGELPILYEDARVVVVDKPDGMHTVPDRGGKYIGVWGRLNAIRPDADLRIVHRLDALTSGCLMLAKGLEVARALDRAFRDAAVHKEYLALVAGVVARDRFDITGALGPDPRRPGRVKVVRADSRGARAAHTTVAIEEPFRRHTLVRAFPKTGRSHQIRAHLASASHGILGDPDYGGRRGLLLSEIKPRYKIRPGVQERPILRRMFLHAEFLEVPVLGVPGEADTAEPVRVHAPLPRDLEVVVQKLRKFSPA